MTYEALRTSTRFGILGPQYFTHLFFNMVVKGTRPQHVGGLGVATPQKHPFQIPVEGNGPQEERLEHIIGKQIGFLFETTLWISTHVLPDLHHLQDRPVQVLFEDLTGVLPCHQAFQNTGQQDGACFRDGLTWGTGRHRGRKGEYVPVEFIQKHLVDTLVSFVGMH